jgi:deoxyribose-phosphate aldolase
VSTLASYIDHTILKPTTSHIEISKICKEAREYGFAAVCVPPPYVEAAKQELAQSQFTATGAKPHGVKVATVIGFPFGYSNVRAKLAETELALLDGAAELDVVINLTHLKNGNWHYLGEEMQLITDMVHADGALVKTIIESGVLTDEEIVRCCEVYGRIGVDFLKTSTGYAEKGASVHAVQLMRQHLPANIRIKASGGIRTYAFARELIEAGADRLGCSASVEIVKGEADQAAADGY